MGVYQNVTPWTWSYTAADPGFPHGGGGGRQHTILPNFPENCMKSKEFGRPGGGGARAPCAPPKSATGTDVHSISQYNFVPIHDADILPLHFLTGLSSERSLPRLSMTFTKPTVLMLFTHVRELFHSEGCKDVTDMRYIVYILCLQRFYNFMCNRNINNISFYLWSGSEFRYKWKTYLMMFLD